jgi:hypothetical protein
MDAPAAAARKPCCVCDAPGGQHCTKCKSRHYCGKKCQLVDWYERGHKAQCKQLAADYQDRMLDALMPEKLEINEEPAIVEDVAPAAGATAAARSSAIPTQTPAVFKATAVHSATPDWRGTCAICLDLLPIGDGTQKFYECCCEKTCVDCSGKCQKYDMRCPLCRTPPIKSHAEWLGRMQKHVDKGNAEAQYVLGYMFENGGMGLKQSPKRAFQFYQLAAAQGSALAQTASGICYEEGQGVKIDFTAAELWYRHAAEQGYPEAQANLGAMFYHGKGVAQSHEEAVQWYRLAAAQGLPDALFNLGACYQNGEGVPQDDHEALRLFKRAAAKGHAHAAAGIDDVQARLAATSGRPR